MNVRVYGAGIVGLCVALRLRQAYYDVQVLYEDHGASAVATGVSAIKGYRLPDKPLFALKILGHSYLKNLLKELESYSNQTLMYYGVKEYFDNQGDYSRILKRIHRSTSQGSYEVIDNYFFYPRDFFFDVSLVLDILVEYCSNLGVGFKKETSSFEANGHQNVQVYCLGHRISEFYPQLANRWRKTWGYVQQRQTGDPMNRAQVMGTKAEVVINGTLRRGSFNEQSHLESGDLGDFRCKDLWEDCSFIQLHEHTWIIGGVHKSGYQLADVLSKRLVMNLSLLEPVRK